MRLLQQGSRQEHLRPQPQPRCGLEGAWSGRSPVGSTALRRLFWSEGASGQTDAVGEGDVFLCYLVGVKRWVGALKVIRARFRDSTKIWGEEVFPVRFEVEPIMLSAEHGVPMEALCNKLSFFNDDTASGRWSGWVRSSPTKYKAGDGIEILRALEEARKREDPPETYRGDRSGQGSRRSVSAWR